MLGIVIKYSEFFGKEIPEKPLELIEDIPKKELLLTISKINALLNPQGALNTDNSYETQIECVKTITDPDNKSKTSNYKKIEYHYKNNFSQNNSLFTRTTCLYAINEILASDIFTKEEKQTYTYFDRFSIFEYLLICNERIFSFTENSELDLFKKNKIDFFEFAAFNGLSINQYHTSHNSLATFYRAWFFFKTIKNNEKLSKYFSDYAIKNYGTDKLDYFFNHFFSIYFKSYDDRFKLNYIIIPKSYNITTKILNGFSYDYHFENINHNDINTLDFLNLKKKPIYKLDFGDDEKTGYLILDTKFLLNKIYSLFINDFWFDYLKPNKVINRKIWGSFIGKDFLEKFTSEILNNSFVNNKNYILKTFDDLELVYKNHNKIEIADVYIAKRQKVFLGEIKSKYINIIDGYKSVTDIKSFLKLDLKEFYDSFGLEQLVEKTIKDFHTYKKLLNDPNLQLDRKVHIYPAIIVNENILTLGNFSYVLRERFNELLTEHNISIKNKEQLIKPLLVLSIEQLQELEQSIFENSIDFFNYLDAYYYKIRIKKRSSYEDRFDIFYDFSTFNRKRIELRKLFPTRLRKFEWLGIKK